MNVPHPVLLHSLNISMELSSCVQSSERLKKKKKNSQLRDFFFPPQLHKLYVWYTEIR